MLPDGELVPGEREMRELFLASGADDVPDEGLRELMRERFMAAVRARETAGSYVSAAEGASAASAHKASADKPAGALARGTPALNAGRGLLHMRRRLVLSVASAAVVLIAVGIACWALFWSGTHKASAAFADVIAKVKKARTVAFDRLAQSPRVPDSRSRVFMASPGKVRWEFSDGKTWIVDCPSRTRLFLKASEMTARIDKSVDSASLSALDPLADLRGLAETQGRFIGRTEHAGRPAWLYQVVREDELMSIWVEPEDDRPVRMESRAKTGGGGEFIVALDNFAWNVPLDDSMFSLALPPGYTLKDEAPSSATDEALVIDLLRTCAAMADGALPEKLDKGILSSLVQADQKRRNPGSISATQEASGMIAADEVAKGYYRVCMRGLTAIERLKQGGQWLYVGAGAKLGDKDRMLCWWRKTGSHTITAVYADLQARQLEAKDAPDAAKPPRGD